MNGNVLIAWTMNDAPPRPSAASRYDPSWYGMASVKWLKCIEVLRLAAAFDPEIPVTTVRVKSLIVPPGIPDWYTRYQVVERSPVELVGGNVPVAAVAGGKRERAEFDRSQGDFAWRYR